jgi:hypothetical protein
MASTRTPQPTEPARQLAEDIQLQSAAILQEVADLLAALPDEELFGDNEFVVRGKVLKIVAAAYQARLDQKKTATKEPASTVRTAGEPPVFTPTATKSR